MTAPEEYTRQQAADPATPRQTLADIAALRQDLRPVVALNPAAYPGLLDWLASLGEPGVDNALRQRREQAGGGPSTDPPEAPGVDPGTARAAAVPAAGGFVPVGAAAAAPSGASSYPVPTGPSAYGPPAGGHPSGGPGGRWSGAGVPTPPSSGSRRTMWVVLGVVGVVVLLGIGAVVVLVQLLRGVAPELDETGPGAGGYGEDAVLDALWDACAAEDWEACDDLYRDSPLGSEYEEFGDTCGYRTAGEEWCVDELG
jgi:hypothetical protein